LFDSIGGAAWFFLKGAVMQQKPSSLYQRVVGLIRRNGLR